MTELIVAIALVLFFGGMTAIYFSYLAWRRAMSESLIALTTWAVSIQLEVNNLKIQIEGMEVSDANND